MEIFLFIAIGWCTGILAGLLGIGGGVITVPALYYLLRSYGIPQDHIMHVCVATALASTLFTSLGTTFAHYRKKAILDSILKFLLPGLLIGCMLGAIFTSFLSSNILRIVFGCMTLTLAVYFFFPKLPHLRIARHPNKSLSLISIAIGCLSTLLGVGGGIFTVPVLIGYNVPLRNVIATSSAGTLTTAFAGSLLYLWIARSAISLPDTVGYVNIPAFLFIGLSSLLTTSLGAKWAHTTHPHLIKRIFAVALAGTGIAMIFGP